MICLEKKVKWQPHQDAASCFELILEVATQKIAVSHLIYHFSRSAQVLQSDLLVILNNIFVGSSSTFCVPQNIFYQS